MDVEDKQLLDETYAAYARYLDRNHSPGFGIFPSADPASNYFNQVWARDTAHAAAHYFARAKPGAVIDSLRTFLKHQRTDGALPSRVEREYQTLKLTPGLRRLAGPFFRLIEGSWRGRLERPVHEGQDSAGGEDTVPAVLIAAGELFDASRDGVMDGDEARVFIKENFGKFEKAADFFRTTKTDPADGLAVMTRDNPDWADTIQRKGKLGLINIWWWRGLRHMQDMAEGVGDARAAGSYRRESEKVKQGIMEKLYDVRGGFFRAETNDDRLDAAASIFGALYFLSPDEMLQVEQTLKRRVARASGLQNFDPPYPQKDIFWAHRLMGQWLYHNRFVWPWVTLQNIFLKIKIAREYDDAAIRGQYRREAIAGLVKMAKLFQAAGGAYEVFQPDEPRRGETKFYHPPQNFMGSMAAYQGVYARLKALGWI